MYISGMGEKPAQAVTGQEFCLKWNNHQATLVSILEQQYRQESFVDVTLAVEGVQLMAHKMVLCACSPYFASILTDTPDKHPIVILKDVSPTDMRAILEFMYRTAAVRSLLRHGFFSLNASGHWRRTLPIANHAAEKSSEEERDVRPRSTLSMSSAMMTLPSSAQYGWEYRRADKYAIKIGDCCNASVKRCVSVFTCVALIAPLLSSPPGGVGKNRGQESPLPKSTRTSGSPSFPSGEVSVSEDSLDRLLKVAESLCVRGLADVGSEMHNGTVNTPLTAPGQTQLPSPAPAVTTTSSSPARKKHRRIARSVASPLNVHIPRESPNASSLEPDSASQDPEEIRESEAGRDSSSSGGSPPEKKRKKNQNEEADSQGDEINSSSGSVHAYSHPAYLLSSPDLKRRVDDVYTPGPPYKCASCPKEFTERSAYLRHRDRTHSDAIHPCPDCGSTFKRTDHLSRHLRTVHAHVCPFCSQTAAGRADYEMHILTNHAQEAESSSLKEKVVNNNSTTTGGGSRLEDLGVLKTEPDSNSAK
ncbi:unnamed protein product [Cyprideis torosa]|uniref:Uncharacterized protein n=1 Tax=Cyprideis torosa TaxID=163714 RepID=A0A7R8ZII3_9CRUS|nr:unnamed protein product [Cyprideis torosa]CAG0886188.1 unnamed protein product [Cyprideis torosa]